MEATHLLQPVSDELNDKNVDHDIYKILYEQVETDELEQEHYETVDLIIYYLNISIQYLLIHHQTVVYEKNISTENDLQILVAIAH